MQRRSLGASGVIAILFVIAVCYLASALFWALVLMLVLHAAGVPWTYHHCLYPWGWLMPLVLG